jgi:hypothetical protein
VGQKRFEKIINENLAAAHKVGIEVVAVTCDQETTQFAWVRSIIPNVRDPFIYHPVTGAKVVIIMDVPHCLKNLRNNMMNYNVMVCCF